MKLRPDTICHTICIELGLARYTYLASATLILCGFIIEMILIGQIVAPYIRESEFMPVACSYNTSRYNGFIECQDVNRKPNNNFPCLEVRVNFIANATSKSLPVTRGVANIYSVLSYYDDSSSKSQCSSRICYRDSTLNVRQIANLNVTLYNGNSSYLCYVRQETPGKFVALKTHEITERQVFHCLLWPSLLCGFGFFLLWTIYCCLGCKVWPKGVTA